MTTILDRIVATKRKEVDAAERAMPLATLRERASLVDPPRDFFSAVVAASPGGIRLIAEIKKASPSAGVIVERFNPVEIARTYHRHGAAALSVLTDETYFQGRLEHIQAVKQVVPLPVLRKDFVIDLYQIVEARAGGADAVLLIAEVLGAERLGDLVPVVAQLGMTALVEVHSEAHLDAVLHILGPPGTAAYLLGINNRDLAVQRTDVATTARLARRLPPGAAFVAESGIATAEDVAAIQGAGASAMLIGESLLRAEDIGATIATLLRT